MNADNADLFKSASSAFICVPLIFDYWKSLKQRGDLGERLKLTPNRQQIEANRQQRQNLVKFMLG
jgi:hypothetical protein